MRASPGLFLLLSIAPALQAQLPPLLPEEREIALARSAAPEQLSAGASVYVLRRGGQVRVKEGTNGAVCLVSRDHPESLYPICYDPEAARTILPVELEQQRLRERGLSEDSIDALIAGGFKDGAFTAPTRPAIAYMMSPHQVIYAGAKGRRVGAWFPHLMIYGAYRTVEDLAMPGLANGDLTLSDAGKPTAHFVVMTREWAASAPLPNLAAALTAQPNWLCKGDEYVLRWNGQPSSLIRESEGATPATTSLRDGLRFQASLPTLLRAVNSNGEQLAADTISLHPERMEHNLIRPAATCAGRLSMTSMAIPPATASDRIKARNVTNRSHHHVVIVHRGVTVRLAPGESTDRFRAVPFSGDWGVIVETGDYNEFCPIQNGAGSKPAPRIDLLIVTSCD
jgi:hypothetical protein